MTARYLNPRRDRPDDLYAEIIALTARLSDSDAFARQARLILLLANEIGDIDTVTRLVRIAAEGESALGGGQ